MPTRTTLDAFLNDVTANRHVEAVERFYLDDAFTQENQQPPVIGKAAIIAKEKKAIAGVKEIHTHKPLAVVHDGDHVVIHWIFDIVDGAGQPRRLKELALQVWDGEKIESEQFFYDSATAWAVIEAMED